MKLSSIQIRDPFILPVKETGTYHLYGTTGPNIGFDCYRSRDLAEWEGPLPAFRSPPQFWATRDFWAPEVHYHAGRYHMFASFKADGHARGTQILVADRPEGPFGTWSDGPVTPRDWKCLDGTLHFDEAGDPWIVFCHEWLQIHDGTMDAQRLSTDLKKAIGEPVLLFNASAASWAKRLPDSSRKAFTGVKPTGLDLPDYVTDEPFLHRTKSGELLMLWSSFGEKGYAMGIARSASGTVQGPWTQAEKPLWPDDGGHGMLFRTFDGRLFLSLHQPNNTPMERAVLRELTETNDSLILKPV